ncbi:GntR family transcriptional regulator [Rhizobium rhizogenes]|uniref:GntR family transcriptional regulator n=1 Tax=Rhizobium rhizogenes TaxID=359 RepID=UPI0022C0A13D|nr:GntR family transcriptional regulator [Rhizobium rhizogenes]MCZ7486110.1 GntR family transcriptional regulator [Rhizobium rhizogenes]
MTASLETFEVLRSEIVSGKYQPMHPCDPRRLSEEHLISVAPIREAMLRLSERGLLRWERNRGFFVEKISSSSALFHLDQLRSHYRYAMNRVKDNKDIKDRLLKAISILDGDDLQSYVGLHSQISAILFSESEYEFVCSIWDRIWIYRNRYLQDDELRCMLISQIRHTIRSFCDGRYDETQEKLEALFNLINEIFPNIVAEIRD